MPLGDEAIAWTGSRDYKPSWFTGSDLSDGPARHQTWLRNSTNNLATRRLCNFARSYVIALHVREILSQFLSSYGTEESGEEPGILHRVSSVRRTASARVALNIRMMQMQIVNWRPAKRAVISQCRSSQKSDFPWARAYHRQCHSPRKTLKRCTDAHHD